MSGVIVFGGYGVFGTHVARELVRRGVEVTIAGRDPDKAAARARALGLGPERGISADASDLASCRRALAGHRVAVSCAGPVISLEPAILEVCLEAGCHYADITDHRAYAAFVRSYGERFAARGLAAVGGCSSMPGISGALGLIARDGAPPGSAPPEAARATLFIGNSNPKGEAAVRSAVEGLGREIAAPQGPLRGFRDREVVALPPPWGRRAAYSFATPDYDVLPALLGVRSVRVKVAFELRLGTLAFAALAVLASLGLRFGRRTARLLAAAGGLAKALGCSGGAVQTELFYPDGSVRRAWLSGESGGQRMAALPCALVAEALARREPGASGPAAGVVGAAGAYDVLGARAMLEAIAAEGFTLGGDAG